MEFIYGKYFMTGTVLDPIGSLVSTLLVSCWLVVGRSHFFQISKSVRVLEC